ncbi:ATP synthase F1 subunit gamma [Spiroplasma platyhelix]|nr:ATP synthase F1 subunit gamma [Spiroplasma platyhelix]MBE4704231.1 ATP synthase gamma chain, sodium ion specific [Spiroplasma platyhelix PALS-1]UJB28815.1 F0F1 ATP synthase subunit gamma [Spiroplasma platyhelix PALS-1]
MAQSMEQIRQRIKVIEVNYKITKATQLVATAKLKRIGKRIEAIKPYYSEVYDTFHQLLPKLENSLYIKDKPIEPKKTLWVVFNSSLGLCGGFNSNLNKMVLPQLKADDEIIAIGSKAVTFFKNHHKTVIKEYLNFNINSTYNDSQDIALTLMSQFNDQSVDSIKIAYTKYINTVTMTPTIIDLLPIVSESKETKGSLVLTDFEPSPGTVIETAIPLYIGAIIYGALIESQVSEQASRRVAMENASNNARDMKDDLLIHYNRARQGAITQEISEIIGGADAQKTSS